MRRRNCKRLLAGMLCVVMILTNGAVTGVSVQASEIGQMGNESTVAELPDESTESGEEAQAEEKEDQTDSEESTEEAGNSTEGSAGETEDTGKGSEGDKTENNSEKSEDAKEEDGNREETGNENDDNTEEESGQGEPENSTGNGGIGAGEDIEESEKEKPDEKNAADMSTELIGNAEERLSLMTADDDIASGFVDEDYGHIAWVIDANGKLTVEGTGDFADPSTGSYLDYSRAPWNTYPEYLSIKSAEVNVSGMTDASYMFCRGMEITDIDLGNFSTDKITNMEYMFCCSKLTSLDLSGFDTSKVTNMTGMFSGCNSLTSLDLGSFKTSNVTSMGGMFENCNSLKSLDLSGFDTRKVTDMIAMFEGCNSLTSLSISNFYTGNVTNMDNMFYDCHNLADLDVSNFDTRNVTSMDGMFSNCRSLTSLNVSNFDTRNVTYMGSWFVYTDLDPGDSVEVSGMFSGCSSLTELNVSNFDTSNVISMWGMFYKCSNLERLDLSNFNTSHVRYMAWMFYGCNKLSNLDVSNFNTSNVENISGMFGDCSSLTKLDLSSFDLANASGTNPSEYWDLYDSDVFTDCSALLTIYTPCNLKYSVILPANSDDVWCKADGKTLTELPQNLDYSIILGKNYIPKEDITSITDCIGGTINGRGVSFGRVNMVYQGEVIANKQVRWKFDGYDMDFKLGETDENGYFMMESPSLSYDENGNNDYTLEASVSYFTGNTWLPSPEKYTMKVKVEPLTVSQKWQLKTEKSIELGIGASAGFEVGPAKMKASLAEVGASASSGGTLTLSHEYDNGMRKLSLMQTISKDVALKSSVGPTVSADFGTVTGKIKIVGAKGETAVGDNITYGLEINNYDPANLGQLLQVGKFITTAQMYNTGNVFLKNALILWGFDNYDIKGAGVESSLSSGASAFGVGISDSNGENIGFSMDVLSIDYDRTYSTRFVENGYSNTNKYELEIASDSKEGILNFGLDGNKTIIESFSLGSIGISPRNTGINLKTDKNRNLIKAEYTDKTYTSWGVPFYTNTNTNEISFSISDPESLQRLNRVKKLQNIIEANNEVFFPESYITDTWEDIRNSADAMEFDVACKEKSMVKVPISLGLDLIVKAGASVDLSGSSEISYVTQTGYAKEDSLYVTAEMQNTKADIDAAKMNVSEFFTAPLEAAGKKIGEFITDTAGKVVDGVKSAGAWVGDKFNTGVDWVVHIISFKKNRTRASANPQSFAINTYMNAYSDASETPGVSMTVGDPYLVYVTDASENEISDFTNHPLELRLDYDSASLQAAGVTTDQASALAIYMYSEEKCGYIYLGGQVDTENQQVAVDITKPGQYLLAVDTLAPTIYDIYISDTSSKPTITAFFSELSGFSQFSMKIDGVEYVNETTLNQYLDQSSGSFVYKVETPLEDGEHTLSFTATDSRGNATAEPITFVFVVGETPEYNPPETGDVLPEDMPEDGKIPDGLWIAAISDTVYTGKAIKPVPHVYDSDVRLKAGTDYTVTYKNNVKASDASNVPTAPTITVTGKGNYSGKDTIIFKILPIELTESNMKVADMTSAFNQQIQEPVPSITVNGKKLKRQTDFFVSYPDYTPGAYRDIGTYRISITGTGNYTGEQTLTFDITDKLLISKASVSKIRNQAYTGKAVTPAPVVKYQNVGLVEHKDYELEYQNNFDIGKATVVIKGIGDYAGKKSVSFQITGGSIKKAKVTGLVSPIVYTGEELLQNCSLSMLVNDVDIPLKEGKDYTVTYKNNIKAGTAKVIFTGINGYTGKIQKSYKITPYDILSNNSSYIEYTKNIVCTYLKGGSRPEPDLYFKGTLLKKGIDYTLSYRNNNAVRGEQMPTIVVKGKGSFKNKIEIPFTIEPQNLSNMTLASCDKVYEDKADIYKITPKLLDINGKALSAGKDFDKNSITYAYENDVVLEDGVTKKAGNKVEATDIIPANTRIRVTLACGSGDLYKGTFTGTYRIVAADIKSAKVSIPAQIYTGSEITPDKTQIRVTLSELYLSPEDYDIVSYANNIKKGKASVTIIGKGNYGGTKTVKFTIKAKGFLWWWR